MMKSIYTLLLLLCPWVAFAQGIQFEQGSWAEVVDKAKRNNKMIFLDIYAVWCGPCKMLDKNTFPNPEVGAFFNANFVNYKLDAEKGEGKDIAKKYAVSAYPTSLFIDPASEAVVYKTMGYADPAGFLSYGKTAVDIKKNQKSPKDIEKILKSGKYNKEDLKGFLNQYQMTGEDNTAILKAYVKLLETNREPADFEVILKNMQTLEPTVVKFINSHLKDINGGVIQDEIWMTEFYQKALEKAIKTKDSKPLDAIEQYQKQYPASIGSFSNISYYKFKYYAAINDEAQALQHAQQLAQYVMKQDANAIEQVNASMKKQTLKAIEWQLKQQNIPQPQWEENIRQTLAAYPQIENGGTFSIAGHLNEVSMYVLESNTADAALIKAAVEWSKRASEMMMPFGNLYSAIADTYAHLLSKDGQKELAIQVMQAAVEKADINSRPKLADRLNRLSAN